jgi:outer membrane lipoprotein-sorting protein
MTPRASIFLLLLLITSVVNAQTKDGAAILEQVKEKFYVIKEYEANVKIKVDVDFVKIPVKQGLIWFMQPDKVKVKIPGFSLLPKRGMNFTPNQLLTGNYTAIFIREEKLGDYNTYVIKVIPGNENDDIILSTIWVDQQRMVIRKLETTTKSEGTISMMFRFGSVVKKYDLPEEIVFSFDLRKNELPLGLTGDFENTEPRDKKSKNTKGTVTINYLEYFVNQGRANAAFKQGK